MALLSIYLREMEILLLAKKKTKPPFNKTKLYRNVHSSLTCNSPNTEISLDVFQLAIG